MSHDRKQCDVRKAAMCKSEPFKEMQKEISEFAQKSSGLERREQAKAQNR